MYLSLRGVSVEGAGPAPTVFDSDFVGTAPGDRTAPTPECPSLSHDGSRLVYKKRLGNPRPGVWRLASLDLATGVETLLTETRSVDDQVEWLDGDRVLYGMPRTGTEATTSDIWSVPIDGTGTPEVLIHGAASPAVVRP